MDPSQFCTNPEYAIKRLLLKLKPVQTIASIMGMPLQQVENSIQSIRYTQADIKTYIEKLRSLLNNTSKIQKVHSQLQYILQFILSILNQGMISSVPEFPGLLLAITNSCNWNENSQLIPLLNGIINSLDQSIIVTFVQQLPLHLVGLFKEGLAGIGNSGFLEALQQRFDSEGVDFVSKIHLILQKPLLLQSRDPDVLLNSFKESIQWSVGEIRKQFAQFEGEKQDYLQQIARLQSEVMMVRGYDSDISHRTLLDLVRIGQEDDPILDFLAHDTYTIDLDYQHPEYETVKKARVLCNQCDFENAIKLYLQAFDSLIGQDVSLGILQNNLGYTYYISGQYRKSKEHLQNALKILREDPDSASIILAITQMNLGSLYMDQEKYQKAESYLFGSLELSQKCFGQDSLIMATLDSCMGKLYILKEQYDLAKQRLDKALQIRESRLPPEHPDIATVYYLIGEMYYAQQQNAESQVYLRNSLRMRKQSLPKYHYDIAVAYNTLGNVLLETDDQNLAGKYLSKALWINKLILPKWHPNIASSHHGLGNFYLNQDNFNNAISQFQKCLQIRQQSLQPYHRDLATIYNDLGYCYFANSDYDQPKEYYLKCLHIREKVLPADHRDLAITYDSLGHYFLATNNFQESRRYYEKSLEIKQNTLPPDDPEMASIYHWLGKAYASEANFKKAEEFYLKCLRIRRNSPEKDNLELANIIADLGYHFSASDRKTALGYFKEALKIRKKKLPHDNPQIMELQSVLAQLKSIRHAK